MTNISNKTKQNLFNKNTRKFILKVIVQIHTNSKLNTYRKPINNVQQTYYHRTLGIPCYRPNSSRLSQLNIGAHLSLQTIAIQQTHGPKLDY